MGNRQSNRSIQPFLYKYVSELNYEETINRNVVYNTVIADIEDEGPVVIKMYFDSPKKGINEMYEDISIEIERLQETFNLNSHPNVLPYEGWFLKNNNCILIMRQYIAFSLREKISQKLQFIEKKWLAFQLLWAVSQLHSKAVTHGDIKPENILLTSYNWLFITDFLSLSNVVPISHTDEKTPRYVDYKPTYVEEDAWNHYNMFFGELENNKRCYIAPERCLPKGEYYQKTWDDYSVQPSMDVFSVGWVIAEIFLDGKPLFDLARHQLYRRNQFNPRDSLRMIDNEEIEELIMDMISLDPRNRKSIDIYRTEWVQKVFPPSFPSITFQLGAVMLRENLLFSDERVAMIRKYFDACWMACFGESINPQELLTPTNSYIFEYIRFDNFPNIITDLYPDFDCVINHKNNGERTITPITFENDKVKDDANDSALVLAIMIGTLLPSCRCADSKIVALEMLKSLGRQIREKFRLQYIVPYCISWFNDPITKVRISAIDSVIEVLKDVESIEVGHTDYWVFDNYIFPAFYKLLEDGTQIIQLKFIEVLPNLINIAQMLIASVNTHKQRITMIATDEQLEVEVDPKQREEMLFQHINQSAKELDKNDYKMHKLEKASSTQSEEVHIDTEDNDTEEELKEEAEGENSQNHPTTSQTEATSEHREEEEKVDDKIKVQKAQDYEEEMVVTTKAEVEEQLKQEKRNIITQSILDESNAVVPWSRKKFVTQEQKVRSFHGIAYNMSLNDNESDMSDDPDQEDEIEKEIDILREKIFEVVDKIISEQDTTKNYVMMLNLENVLEFLGEDIVSEKLLPYILSFPNLKDHMLTLATLKALRALSHYVVGTDELKYILTSCENLFYDLNECIVFEAIKTVEYIATQHLHVFEENRLCISLIAKLICFAMHPNEQIKAYAIKAICQLIRDKTVAYIFCNVTPVIKGYLTSPTIMKIKQEKEFHRYIKKQVSRFCFDLTINKFGFTSSNPVNLSFQDMHSICQITPMINCIPKQQPSKSIIELKDKLVNSNSYGVRKVNDSEQFDDPNEDLSQYVERFYYPMVNNDVDVKKNEDNYRLNKSYRHPNKSVNDVYYQQLHNSVKGLTVTKDFTGSHSNASMIKRSVDMSTSEDEGVIGNWRPRGRLINTIYPENLNDMVNPIMAIEASKDSKALISGSKNGMIHYFNLIPDAEELKVNCSESMLITDLNKPKHINCISIINDENTFWVGMDSGTLDIYAPNASQNDSIGLVHRIMRPDEGSICKTCNYQTDFGRDNVFAYATQKGFVHTHDLRVKLDVNTYELGLKFGMPTAMTTANINGTNKLVVGTVNGFIHLYDVRYNVPITTYEHSRNHPILDMCMYYPTIRHKYKMFTEINETQNPHILIATGGSIAPYNQRSSLETPQMVHEVSFMDIYSGRMKGVFCVDDTLNSAYEPVEVSEFYSHDPIDLMRKTHFTKFNEGINKTFTSNYVTKLISPLLQNKQESAPYFISAGTDRKIRYWNMVKDTTATCYNISTPVELQTQYKDFFVGDVLAIQEKVTDQPLEDVRISTNANYTKKKKAILGSKGNADPINAINEGLYSEQNGISACQPFNACNFVDIKNSSDLAGSKIFENSAHSDAILDMTVVETYENGPYLFSAGRDGVIKMYS